MSALDDFLRRAVEDCVENIEYGPAEDECEAGGPHRYGMLEENGTGRRVRGCVECERSAERIYEDAQRREAVDEIDGVPFVNTEPLVCALCGSSEPKFDQLPEPAGPGFFDGVFMHPHCLGNLRKYGAR